MLHAVFVTRLFCDSWNFSECILPGTCKDGINNYNCKCERGFTGFNCEQEIDECLSFPCIKGNKTGPPYYPFTLTTKLLHIQSSVKIVLNSSVRCILPLSFSYLSSLLFGKKIIEMFFFSFSSANSMILKGTDKIVEENFIL